MSGIKKVYQNIINHLEANKDKKVSAVLPEVIAMAQVKQTRDRATTSFIKDVKGNTVAIRDYYFGRWMPLVGPAGVAFSEKKDSPSGYSGLSKLGQSKFSSAKNLAIKEDKEVFNRLLNGEITADQAKAEREAIEQRRKTPVITEEMTGKIGFETLEECKEYLAGCRVKLPAEEAANAKKAA